MPEDPRSIVRRSTPPDSTSSPVVTPLSPTVVWSSSDPDALDAQYTDDTGFTYAREGHPNAVVLADKLDWLHGAETGAGVVVGSGMAAIGSIFLGLLRAGDHVIGGDQAYGRSLRLLGEDLPRMGFATTLVDATNADAVAEAIVPETRLILIETMSNPTLRVADLGGIVALARERGVLVAVDNTFATPRAVRPFDHGADLVVESVTKLLGGHSDVTLGYVAARDPQVADAIRTASITWGPTPSPFDCWLAERGLHTFEIRYDRAASNAVLLADHLAGLDGVRHVIHPLRTDHPDHDRARSLFGERGGSMVSFVLEGGREAANAFVRAARPIVFAPTLGDVGTTLSHPASSSHRALTPTEREALGIPEGFIRVSTGIEDIDQLRTEFTTAVAATRPRTQGS